MAGRWQLGKCGACRALALVVGCVAVAAQGVAVKVTKGDDLGQYHEFTLGGGTSIGVEQTDHTLLLEHATRVDLLLVGGGGGGTSGGGGGGGGGVLQAAGVLLQPGSTHVQMQNFTTC